ncbi:MAG: MFS transporter [Paenibacillaceae bacterium]
MCVTNLIGQVSFIQPGRGFILERKAIRAWMMYDWANSAFATTMLAAVLPIFYYDVAGKNLSEDLAASYWGYTQSIALILVAIMAPLLGAIADLSGSKLRFLRVFAFFGILASALFVFVGVGDYVLASCLMIVGMIGFSGGNTFYDSMLTDLVPNDQRDMVSSKGYTMGYVGGGTLLAVNLLMIKKPELFGLESELQGTYAAFLSVAVWWYIFSRPIFRRVGQFLPKPVVQYTFGEYVGAGAKRLARTLRSIKHYPELLKYLIAFWLFSDGINTVIAMATIYGKTIGIGTSDLITALLITQFVGIPFTLLFGKIAVKLGSKKSLYITLSTYVGIVLLGYFMQNATHFYLLAIMVGMVQGGSQAVARSIFSKLVPQTRSAEFFGFLSVSSKFSSSFGPFVFAIVGQITGNARYGILALLLFFVGGIILLTRVNLAKGEREAVELEQPHR